MRGGRATWSVDAVPAERLLTAFPETFDVIVTDPPYGIKYKSGRQGVDREKSIRTRADEVVRNAYFGEIVGDRDLPTSWLVPAYESIRPGGALYVFCKWSRFGRLAEAVASAGFRPKNMIVLHKSNHGMGDLAGSYAPKHELILFATKGRHALRFPGGRAPDVWDVPVRFSGARRRHPNEKPVSWYETPIIQSSDEGGVICDPFCGSGTCGVAALRHGRHFVGGDVDETWAVVARGRLAKK